MSANPVKEKLTAGGRSLGHFLMEFVSPGLMTVLARAGFEFVVIDTEHTRFSIETVCEQIRHARSARIVSIVRVPRGQLDQVSRYMDAGADGVMSPNCESAEEARRIVDAVKYAPAGKRGTCFRTAHDDYAPGDVAEKIAAANARSMVVTQIESPAGVEAAGEIAAVEGVDVLWIGHFDLTQAMGIPAQFEHPDFLAHVNRVLDACKSAGKAPGILAADPEGTVGRAAQGFRCLAYGVDMRVYQEVLTDGVRAIREKLG